MGQRGSSGLLPPWIGGSEVALAAVLIICQSGDLRGQSQTSSGAHGVDAVMRANGYEAEPAPPQEAKKPELRLLDLRIIYDGSPPYIRDDAYDPAIPIEPLKDCPQLLGLKNLAQKELFRHLRSRLKREWRNQYTDSNMSYDFYVDRLLDINQVGRYVSSRDQVTEEYYLTSARDNIFHRYRDGEEEIPVLKLGPLVVLDTGSLSFDQSLLTGLFRDEEEKGPLEFGPELEGSRRPLFTGKGFRVHTRFRLAFNPIRAFRNGDPMDAVTSYGAVVDIAWLTDILRRERFVTEFEAQLDRSGELAFFFNLVLKSW